MREPLRSHFDGTELWGNDFNETELMEWHAAEATAYSDLYVVDGKSEYEYRLLNEIHGFSRLPDRIFQRALGLGSGFGEELAPVAGRLRSAVIVESSEVYWNGPSPVSDTSWLRARADGTIPLEDNSCDLATSFGVLHHVPNVERVVGEIGRVIQPNGYLLLREPIISMGDWRLPRPGLTLMERGIPAPLLRRFLVEAGFTIESASWAFFPPVAKVAGRLGADWLQHKVLIRADAALARLVAVNYRYHAERPWQKIRPTSMFIVARSVS